MDLNFNKLSCKELERIIELASQEMKKRNSKRNELIDKSTSKCYNKYIK